jgi:hypothetical protein
MLAYAPSFRDLKLGHNWDVRLLEYVASSLAASVINFLSKYLLCEMLYSYNHCLLYEVQAAEPFPSLIVADGCIADD